MITITGLMGLSFVPCLNGFISFSNSRHIFYLPYFHLIFSLASSPLCVSAVSPRGPATPRLVLPLAALHYCLIICGVSFEYCAVHNSWFSSFTCSLMFSLLFSFFCLSLLLTSFMLCHVVSGNSIATFCSCTVDSPSSSSSSSGHQNCVRTSGGES